MLSILIPTYNYNVFPLVLELYNQCIDCEIEFEILCQDDCSTAFIKENTAINTFENCTFFLNNSNLGRGKNINLVAKKAKYDWLLILDCDTFPTQSDFVKRYIDSIANDNSSVAFGGILYETKKPENNQLLRWVYGNKREAISVNERKKKPNSSALTSNLLIKKELFLQNPFDDNITRYGYEDLCFLSVLETKGIVVNHIKNPTFHLNLETSVLFLNKTKIALENLKFILATNVSTIKDSKILSVYSILKKLKLIPIASFFFNKFEAKITNNLFSAAPSMLLFDLYKLGYFCKINLKN